MLPQNHCQRPTLIWCADQRWLAALVVPLPIATPHLSGSSGCFALQIKHAMRFAGSTGSTTKSCLGFPLLALTASTFFRPRLWVRSRRLDDICEHHEPRKQGRGTPDRLRRHSRRRQAPRPHYPRPHENRGRQAQHEAPGPHARVPDPLQPSFSRFCIAYWGAGG
jgi:hypothetical protein